MYNWEVLTTYKDEGGNYWRVSRAKESRLTPNATGFYETLWQGMVEFSTDDHNWRNVYQSDIHTQYDEPLNVDTILQHWMNDVMSVVIGIAHFQK